MRGLVAYAGSSVFGVRRSLHQLIDGVAARGYCLSAECLDIKVSRHLCAADSLHILAERRRYRTAGSVIIYIYHAVVGIAEVYGVLRIFVGRIVSAARIGCGCIG